MSQQGVPITADESFALSWTAGSAGNRLFVGSSLLEGNRETGEGDVGEERVEVAAVEAEDDEEELPSGRHSSQQQQQQSMKAWPSERQRHSSITGVAEQRTNSRNCPIRPSAGRTSAGSAEVTGTEMYASVMLHTLSGRLHVVYKTASAITVVRSRCSLPCSFFLVEEEDEEEEEHLLVTLSLLGFCGSRCANTCFVTKSQASVKSSGKQR